MGVRVGQTEVQGPVQVPGLYERSPYHGDLGQVLRSSKLEVVLRWVRVKFVSRAFGAENVSAPFFVPK